MVGRLDRAFGVLPGYRGNPRRDGQPQTHQAGVIQILGGITT